MDCKHIVAKNIAGPAVNASYTMRVTMMGASRIFSRWKSVGASAADHGGDCSHQDMEVKCQ